MELDTSFRKVFCCGNPEEKKALIPVDCSIILPDYFPDVMKILRYTAKTVKFPVASDGETETVSGNVNIEVNYVSEEGELCSCSQLQPFSHVFDCGGNVAAAETDICVGEMGCRAVNKRRIDLHGSIEAVLRVISFEEKSFVSSVNGAGTVCREKGLETVAIAGEFFKSFTLEEKGELGYGKPPFGRILRSAANAEVTECHVIQDKIVTKGEIRVSVLWMPEREEAEESGPFLSEFVFPVSRMVDAPGIMLTDICDAGFEADFSEITPSEDGQSINIKVKTGIFARVYRKERADFVDDMFSTDFETRCEKEKFSVISEAVPVSANETFYEKFELPETAETVTDIWVEPDIPEITAEGKILLNAKLCMFAKDADESPVYFERQVSKEIASGAAGKNIVFHNLSAGVKSTEFRVEKDKNAEVTASMLIDGTLYCALSTEAVTACSIDRERKIEHGGAAMVFCFAEKGENVWDIAKKYGASMEGICSENGISGEILPDKTMLVITK